MVGKIAMVEKAGTSSEPDDDWSERVAGVSIRPSHKPDVRAAEKDHEFLRRLRAAGLRELIAIAQANVNAHSWRHVAIDARPCADRNEAGTCSG